MWTKKKVDLEENVLQQYVMLNWGTSKVGQN